MARAGIPRDAAGLYDYPLISLGVASIPATEVADAYAVPGTPSAVLIGPDGRITSLLAIGREAITKLVDDELPIASISSTFHDEHVRRLRALEK